MGFSHFRTPEYLYRTPSGLFIFRIKVPRDCRPVIRRKELQYSLKTRCIYTARKLVAGVLLLVQDLFNSALRGLYTERTQALATQTIKDIISQAKSGGTSYGPPLPQRQLSPSQETKAAQPSPGDESVHQGQQEELAPPSPTEGHPVPPSKALDNQALQPPSAFKFSDLTQEFFKEKKISGGWREKTEEDHRAVFGLFQETIGDLPVSTIDKATMRQFKSTIIQLPPNMRKVARYAKKSIPEIVAMKPGKTLSAHTVNKYLSRLGNLFSYAVTHGLMAVNPAGGFKVKLKSRPDEEREAYSADDLRKLFTPPDTNQPSRYWVPLIALFAGCRLEEICQLHLEDIRQEGETWIFDINARGEKVLKNLSSVRLIPIHSQLIALGLLEYAEQLRTKGESRLFPELHRRRDGYGQVISKWFQYFKKLRGIGPGKTFHSFRHTFITHLKHKQVDPFMIHELDGHAIGSETMGRYGKRYTPEILLKEAIKRIDYGLELTRVYPMK